jgi:integrase
MRGSLRARGPKRWQLRVYEGRNDITGRKTYRTRTVEGTKREAQTALAAMVAEVEAGIVKPKAMTVAEMLEAWLKHIEHLGRSPSTLYGYRRLVLQLPDGFKDTPIAKVTPKLIDDLYAHLSGVGKRKAATVLRYHAVLRAAFAQAERWSWVDRNPVQRATPPRVQHHEIRPPGVEEVLAVIEAAGRSRNPENALVFRLLAATGCRRGEVCGLQWGDVDFDAEPVAVTIRRGVVDVEGELIVKDTKTHAQRRIGVDPDTATLLRAQWKGAVELGLAAGAPPKLTDFVFAREPGSDEPLPPDRITQAWRRLCQESGVNARLHDLRHLQASMLLDAGESVTVVAARLGHRDTSTTLKVYSHLMPGADARAASLVGSALSRPKQDNS